MKIEYQRFRANIYASGGGAWSERELIEKQLQSMILIFCFRRNT